MSITAYPTANVRRRATVSGDNNMAKCLVILLFLLGLVPLVRNITLKSKDLLRSETREIVDKKEAMIETKLKNLFVRIDQLEKSVEELTERVKKENNEGAGNGVECVNYALRSSGARVLKHSEVASKLLETLFDWFLFYKDPDWVSPDAKKMLAPSFDEPGHCLALKGTTGFVVIKLSRPIIPEAFTLEHLPKGVMPDEYRSSAPKDCKVSGWLGGSVEPKEMFDLAEFSYDIEKSSAQTFNASASTMIDTVRLDVKSNHGKSSHTCIYRLKVHGHEPESASIVKEKRERRRACRVDRSCRLSGQCDLDLSDSFHPSWDKTNQAHP